MKLSAKLKYIRTEIAQITQTQFANKLNVTRNTVKNWESGFSKPTIHHIVCISILWNISTDFLLVEHAPEALCLLGVTDRQYEVISACIRLYKDKNI